MERIEKDVIKKFRKISIHKPFFKTGQDLILHFLSNSKEFFSITVVGIGPRRTCNYLFGKAFFTHDDAPIPKKESAYLEVSLLHLNIATKHASIAIPFVAID